MRSLDPTSPGPAPTRTLARVRILARGLILALLLLALLAPSHPQAQPKGTPVGDDTPTVLRTPASKEDRDRMRAHLTSAERAVPKPSSTFRLAHEGEERDVGTDAGKLDESHAWNPIEAWTSRVYETRDATDEERTIEINLALNGQHGISSGLASVGGPVQILSRKGALVVRQSIIGADEGSRVALPLSPEDEKRALTLVRFYVVPPEVEARLRKEVERTEDLPRLGDAYLTAHRPDAIASIILEVRGERRDIEALVPKVDVSALRKLIAP